MRFPRVFRRFENIDALLGSIVEGVADAAGVARVGIFSGPQGEQYRLRAGLRCLPETQEMEFGERDALVRWFESNASLIARANLPQTADQKAPGDAARPGRLWRGSHRASLRARPHHRLAIFRASHHRSAIRLARSRRIDAAGGTGLDRAGERPALRGSHAAKDAGRNASQIDSARHRGHR